MNREEIIRMAREAGAKRNSDFPDWSFEDDVLHRFAAIVAAAEREACAKECDHWQYLTEKAGRQSKDGAYIAAAIRGRGKA